MEIKNEYDFTVEDLTEILENTPIRVDFDTNAEVAKYIIRSLNINRMIKEHLSEKDAGKTEKTESKRPEYIAPFHLEIKRNTDGATLFKNDVRSIAFYAYDPFRGQPHKGIVVDHKVTPTDIGNICELLGDVNEWGHFR